MEQAVAAHAARLGEKLQARGTRHRPRHRVLPHERARPGRPSRSVCTTVSLPEASSDTLLLARAATWAVRRTWRDGFRYSKAGIVTMDLVRLAGSQRALPGVGQQDRERSAALMAALDKCNRRFGRGTVVTASAGMPARRTWSTKFEMRSPRYTTRLSELPVVGDRRAPACRRPRRACLCGHDREVSLRPPPSSECPTLPSMPYPSEPICHRGGGRRHVSPWCPHRHRHGGAASTGCRSSGWSSIGPTTLRITWKQSTGSPRRAARAR